MKIHVTALLFMLANPLPADLGLSLIPTAITETAISGPCTGLAVCFEVSESMEARAIAMACDSVRGSNSYFFSLTRERKGRPGDLLAQSSGVVPAGKAWMQGQLDGVALLKGERVCITLTRDLDRGGQHPVDGHSHGKDSQGSLSVLSNRNDAGSRSFNLVHNKWIDSKSEPLWALLGRGKKIMGQAWSETTTLPIHGGGSPENLSDDLWQAQVFHFPCGQKPDSVKARVRKIGKPKNPLIMAVLKHEYVGHGIRPLFDFKFADADAVTNEWRWIETALPESAESFPPDCHYFALKTLSGNVSGNSCNDCYEISGARVLRGLELVQELSWYGGAHKDRASSSLNALKWKDDFEADLNMLTTGPSCPDSNTGQAPRVIPTPVPALPW